MDDCSKNHSLSEAGLLLSGWLSWLYFSLSNSSILLTSLASCSSHLRPSYATLLSLRSSASILSRCMSLPDVTLRGLRPTLHTDYCCLSLTSAFSSFSLNSLASQVSDWMDRLSLAISPSVSCSCASRSSRGIDWDRRTFSSLVVASSSSRSSSLAAARRSSLSLRFSSFSESVQLPPHGLHDC
jgi:hypothetical protein